MNKPMATLNEKMTKIIQKCFNVDAEAVFDASFWASTAENAIGYSLLACNCDSDFCKYVNETFDCDFKPLTMECFLLSLMHEIGHLKTLPKLSDNVKARNQLVKILIDRFHNPENVNGLINYLYFNLKMEKVATAWAIHFIKKYPNRVKWLEKQVNKAVQEFYGAVASP